MSDKNIFQDADYLQKNQYRDGRNLNARAELHHRFSTATVGWHSWVFDHLALQPGMRVLECGCGPGWLWRDKVDRLPESDWQVQQRAVFLSAAGCTVSTPPRS